MSMILFRWLIGLIFIIVSVYLICINASIFWDVHMRKIRAPSWTPLVNKRKRIKGNKKKIKAYLKQ